MLFFPKNELNGTSYVLKIAVITLLRRLPTIYSPELAVMPTRNMIKESRYYLKKRLDVQKCCACVAKHIVVMINRLTSTSSVARGSIKEKGGDGPMSKYRKVLQEAANVTSTKRRFRTTQHSVATYEQKKKGLSYFYPKRIVEEVGIHTKLLHL